MAICRLSILRSRSTCFATNVTELLAEVQSAMLALPRSLFARVINAGPSACKCDVVAFAPAGAIKPRHKGPLCAASVEVANLRHTHTHTCVRLMEARDKCAPLMSRNVHMLQIHTGLNTKYVRMILLSSLEPRNNRDAMRAHPEPP